MMKNNKKIKVNHLRHQNPQVKNKIKMFIDQFIKHTVKNLIFKIPKLKNKLQQSNHKISHHSNVVEDLIFH